MSAISQDVFHQLNKSNAFLGKRPIKCEVFHFRKFDFSLFIYIYTFENVTNGSSYVLFN